MDRDELTATSILKLEDGNCFDLNYYIRTTMLEDGRVFAVRIDQTEPEKGRLVKTESSLALSDDYDGIQRMVKTFADGQVTPSVLIEMCDEWAGRMS